MICVYKMCSTAFDWSITSAIATLIRKWNASWQSHAMMSFNGSLKVHMTRGVNPGGYGGGVVHPPKIKMNSFVGQN